MWAFFHQAKETSQNAEDVLDQANRLASHAYAPGFHAARKAGQGESFWQFRRYLPDDPRRDIDWRKSARSEATIIRQREDQKAQSLHLWVDPNSGMDISYASKRPAKTHCANVLTLALGFLALRQHDIVRSIGSDSVAARSDQSMADLAHHFEQKRAPNFADLQNTPLSGSGLYVLAGDFLEPPERIEKNLKHAGHPDKKFLLLHCLDPDELTLPYTGRVLFSNSAEESSQRIDHVPDVSAAYQEKMQSHLRALEELCAAQGILYLRHLCGEDMAKTLNAAIHLLNEESRGA